MTTCLLIRHGLFDGIDRMLAGRTPGIHLNEQGRRQAQRLAERLAPSPVSAIFASPRERACETAAPIARRLGLSFQVSEALDEIDFGLWTGRRFDDLNEMPAWKLFNSFRSHTRVPGGEGVSDVQARVVAEIQRLSCRFPEGIVTLVTHGDVIRAALVYYLGIPIDFTQRMEISPGSATILTINSEGPRVVRLNDIGCEPLLCAVDDRAVDS